MRSEEYTEMFQKFYDHGHMASTYKGVFLYALTDIGHYENKNLIGSLWLKPNGNKIKMELDFIAIRFIRYYWEIAHMEIRHTPKNMANDSDPKLDYVNILKLIKSEEKNHNTIPNLQELASSKMGKFRKSVITHAIRKEVLNHLLTDFNGLYEKVPKENHIIIDSELVKFMKKNRDHIRGRIEIKIYERLKQINSNSILFESSINKPSPFYLYVKKHKHSHPSLFLIGVENKNSMKNYAITVEKKIIINELSKKPISVWGLRSTFTNKQIWKKIRQNDIVLFSQDSTCFAKGRIHSIVQNTHIAKSLWPDTQEGTMRDLLILIDDIDSFHLDLKSSSVRLINPTMDDEYNFAIKRVSDDRIDYLFNVYGGIDSALDAISGPHSDLLRNIPKDVRVVLETGESIIRKGQKKFRDMVLKNYHYRCAVCGITEKNLLEASHILSVKHKDTAGFEHNGICLCVLHHKMFDKGYLYFDSNYNVKLTDDVISENLKKSCIISKISKNSCTILPSSEYLKLHRVNFRHEEN